MTKITRILIGAGVLAATLGLVAAGVVLLPETVGLQITASGAMDNFVPKWLAIALPAVVGGVCALVYCFKKINACLVVSIVMLAAQVLTLVLNR